jgi:hypothetical protein
MAIPEFMPMYPDQYLLFLLKRPQVLAASVKAIHSVERVLLPAVILY